MAFELNIGFINVLLAIISLVSNLQPLVQAEPKVPCYFIFGDSLVDNGNNNDLETTAKANYFPYGIDFAEGPTGRFSNGRNMADIIAELLGFDKFIPPFANASGEEILKGVNYGSGGAGILDETGQQLGGRISMNQQLLNHQFTISQIAYLLGSKEAAENYLSRCLYSVGMGNNDYINNYLNPDYYPTSHLFTPEQFAALLIQQYSRQLRILYGYGARKLAIFGPGLIGCTPAEIANFGTNGSTCVEFITNYVQLFDVGVKSLVEELNNNLTDANFIYINITGISSGNASAAGIIVTNASCCIVATNAGKGQCAPNHIPCANRSIYSFFDGFHPTEVACVLVATRAYNATTQYDAYPYDISRLAESPGLALMEI